MEHTRAHFVRSIMESVACMLKQNLDFVGVNAKEIRSMGGAAKSDVWCRIKADMTGKRLVTLKNKETACLGSAILAGVGTGVFKSVEDAAKMICTVKAFEPSGEDYADIYGRYCAMDSLMN